MCFPVNFAKFPGTPILFFTPLVAAFVSKSKGYFMDSVYSIFHSSTMKDPISKSIRKL